jgi:hypothetical protein
MLIASDILIVAHMDGWDQSYGVGEEIKFFEDSGKPIYDLNPVTLTMARRRPELSANLTTAPSAPAAPSRCVVQNPSLAHDKSKSEHGGSSA